MANWDNPQLTTQYDVFLAECKERDNDAMTLCLNPPTNPPVGAVKMFRISPVPQVRFQQWSGSAFTDVILAVSGGGTGAADASGARLALGLGTMALQNANAVAIGGGTLSSILQLGLACLIAFTGNNVFDIGSNAVKVRKGYFASGLVIPVGADKFATS